MTQEELTELLEYDPLTGKWKWKSSGSGRKANGEAGNLCLVRSGRYKKVLRRVIKIKGKNYLASRLAFLYMTGICPKEVDHKDRNSANDKWENLRDVTRSENGKNRESWKWR